MRDLAAQIAHHRLMCVRCRQGWRCGGLGDEDYENGDRIADLLTDVTTQPKDGSNE